MQSATPGLGGSFAEIKGKFDASDKKDFSDTICNTNSGRFLCRNKAGYTAELSRAVWQEQ